MIKNTELLGTSNMMESGLNILMVEWIVAEDLNTWNGCYSEKIIVSSIFQKVPLLTQEKQRLNLNYRRRLPLRLG